MNVSIKLLRQLIPVDDNGNRGNGEIYKKCANDLIYTIMDTCRQLGATIYDKNFWERKIVFNNGIEINLCARSSFKKYYIITLDISIQKSRKYCNNYTYLNLHQTMALRYKQYYIRYSIVCHLVINKLFKVDIAKYILSYINFNIDFDNLFIPLQPNRCACISTNLLYNILIVLSDQDINNKSLKIVIDKLTTLTDTCSTKRQPVRLFIGGYIQDIYPRLDIGYNLKNIKYNNVHTHLLRKRIPFPSRNTSTSICGIDKKYQLKKYIDHIKYMNKLKYMKKVWSIYSFSLGLIYKLVRENRLVIIANIDIYLHLCTFKMPTFYRYPFIFFVLFDIFFTYCSLL
jgi:hypothetical protein